MSWSSGGPGLTTFGRWRTVGVAASDVDVAEVERLARRLQLPIPLRELMVEQPWTVVDWLHGHARWLDKAGRDTYRRWGEALGLQSAPLNDVTWKVVELARLLAEELVHVPAG